ncbi:MAG: 2'-5' RNA ligase family protein [Patescibacteria group bacterium]
MKYHYYIGLQLPGDVSGKIADIQRELFDPIESVKPLEPHITLLPPPAVEHINPEDFALHARAAAKSSWPLELVLKEIMTFGSQAVAIRVESDAIHELQKQLVELLPFAAEITYYPHPTFLPHITLAQANRGHTLPSKLIDLYKERLAPLLPMSCTAGYLTLFERIGPRTYKAKPLV